MYYQFICWGQSVYEDGTVHTENICSKACWCLENIYKDLLPMDLRT